MSYMVMEESINNSDYMEPNFTEGELSEEEFDKQINDEFGTVEIAGVSWDAAYVFKETDPIAYDVEKGDRESFVDDKWECPICDREYADEDDAKWCCQSETVEQYYVVNDLEATMAGPFVEFTEAEEECERLEEQDKEEQ